MIWLLLNWIPYIYIIYIESVQVRRERKVLSTWPCQYRYYDTIWPSDQRAEMPETNQLVLGSEFVRKMMSIEDVKQRAYPAILDMYCVFTPQLILHDWFEYNSFPVAQTGWQRWDIYIFIIDRSEGYKVSPSVSSITPDITTVFGDYDQNFTSLLNGQSELTCCLTR